MEPALPADVASSLLKIAQALERLAIAQERSAAANEKAAAAQMRLALPIPELADDEARWLFRLGGKSLPALVPKEPEQVSDARTRCVMLQRTWAEKLADWALPKARREAKWKAEKEERESKALQAAEASFASNGQAGHADGTPF